jgi:hypothetical protein
MLHCPPSFIGPYVFVIVFPSHVFKALSFSLVMADISLAYVTTCLIIVLCISNFPILDIILKCRIFCTANRHMLPSAIIIIIIVISLSSSSARQPYVGPGLRQKLLSAKVSGYCFFRFRDKSLFKGGVDSPTPNPRSPRGPIFSVRVVTLSWLAPILKSQDLTFCPCMT